MPTATTFKQVAQADAMWLKILDKKVPVLHIVDVATKYQAACVFYGEKSHDFQKALQRTWFRHFGIPSELWTDEGQGWAADELLGYFTNLNIKHTVSPGEAHQRIGLVERYHQVLRKAAEVSMTCQKNTTVKGLKAALAFVLPQINSQPTVAGYSPAHWVLGYQPAFPGDLLQEQINPV